MERALELGLGGVVERGEQLGELADQNVDGRGRQLVPGGGADGVAGAAGGLGDQVGRAARAVQAETQAVIAAMNSSGFGPRRSSSASTYLVVEPMS